MSSRSIFTPTDKPLDGFEVDFESPRLLCKSFHTIDANCNWEPSFAPALREMQAKL